MMLEENYAWPLPKVGVVVGATLLTAEPWRRIFGVCQAALSTKYWLRTLTLVSFLGSILLFPAAIHGVGNGSEGTLIAADLVLFPALMLLTGIVKGVMVQVAVPGTWISPSNAILAHIIAVDMIGRTMGPPLARAALQYGGQQAYAAHQAALLAFATVVAEAGIVKLAFN